MDRLTLLGTGDALGVPRVYCDCPVCTEARSTGANRRQRCSALLQTEAGPLLLDCGPDWRAQMETAGTREVDLVLLTHAHHDHAGGLPDLADAARWTRRKPQVFGPAAAIAEARELFPWTVNQLDYQVMTGPLVLRGWQVTPWEVSHGINGRAHAFRFSQPGRAWAYCPDSIALTAAEQEPLLGLDLLVLGTAYYQEQTPVGKRSLYDMVEALALLAAVRPKRAIFTHLSHGVDLRTVPRLPAHVRIGRDGQSTLLA